MLISYALLSLCKSPSVFIGVLQHDISIPSRDLYYELRRYIDQYTETVWLDLHGYVVVYYMAKSESWRADWDENGLFWI